MVYLASGGFWLTTGQVISSLSAFSLAIAFANLLPPETYGTYKYLLSIAAIFSIFTLPGMNTAIARSVARGNEITICVATKTRVIWSFLGTLAAFAGATYYFINDNLELAIALAIIGAVLPFFDTLTTYNGQLTGKRAFKKQSIFHLLSQSVSTGSLVTALLLTNNVHLLLLAYFIPLAVTRFVLYKKITKTTSAGTPDRETITYGKHLSLISVLGVVASNIDKILLWKFLGPAQLAIYTFALAIPEQLKGPLKGVGDLAFPKFAAQTNEQIRKNMSSLWRKLALYAVGLVVISALYILAAPYIFKVFFPQYMESVLYSQIFSISLVTSISAILLSKLEAQKKIKTQYIINTIHPLTQIILLVILIPLFGIFGAVAAFIISRLAMTLFIIFLTHNTFSDRSFFQ